MCRRRSSWRRNQKITQQVRDQRQQIEWDRNHTAKRKKALRDPMGLVADCSFGRIDGSQDLLVHGGLFAECKSRTSQHWQESTFERDIA
jgi:hypothetical protein